MPMFVQDSWNQVPKWLQDLHQQIAQRAQAISQEKYMPYDARRMANMPPEMEQARALSNRVGQYERPLEQASQMMNESAIPFFMKYQNYMNPYQEGVIDQLSKRAQRDLQERFLPSIESRFISAGQHGSKRHQELSQRAARDMQEALLHEQRNALQQGYEQSSRIAQGDDSRRLAAGAGLGDITRQQQAGRLSDIAALQEQGHYQQGQEQQGLNTAYSDFLRRIYHPQEQLGQFSATIQGLPAPIQSMSAQYAPPQQQPQVNTMGQIGGLAASLYGAKQMGGFKRGGSVYKGFPPLKNKKGYY